MLEGVGRVIRTGRSLVIRIPVDVARDSAFPFKTADAVFVQIWGSELRVCAVEQRQVEIAEALNKQ